MSAPRPPRRARSLRDRTAPSSFLAKAPLPVKLFFKARRGGAGPAGVCLPGFSTPLFGPPGLARRGLALWGPAARVEPANARRPRARAPTNAPLKRNPPAPIANAPTLVWSVAHPPPPQVQEWIEGTRVLEHAVVRNTVLDGDNYILHVRGGGIAVRT
jgi:hypothetical protein